MNTTDNLDQQLRSTFAATAPKREPDGLFESVMSGTTSVGQRRPLMVRTRELVELPTVRWPAFRAALIALGTIVILLLAFGAALFIGSRLPDPPSIVHGEFTVTGPLNVDPGLEVVVRSSVALPDGRILVIGTSLTRTAGDFAERPWAAVYEPASGTFSETGAPSIARSLSTLTTLADGRVLLAGGFLTPEMFEDPEQAALADPASAEIWDPANGRFERTGQMSVGRYGHTATLLPDGRVLLAGGELDATAELYDPQTGAFHAVNDKMSTARLYAAAAQLADGRVLVTGGSTGDSVSSGAELFDPSTQTFSVVGPMAVGRAEHTATTLGDGRVLVAGGGLLSSSGFLAGDATPAAELFDPASGAFEAVGPMTTERTLHAAARVGDRVLIVGGQNIDGSPRTAELFDPATGSFLQAGRAPAGDYDTTASLLPDGDVLVTAGAAAPVVWTAAEISAPDPVGNAPAGPGFSTLEWPTLRYGQTATTLADGRVLIAGGRDSRSGESSAAAELFDPRTGATTAIRMQLAHSDHAAVRLDDGRVLIVGGAEPAELFDPTTATFETTDSPRLPAPGPGSGPPTSDATHALVLANGRVLVLAHARPGAWARATVIYDPVTESFGARHAAECQAAVAPVRLLDDRVFLPCGRGMNQAIVYDPTGATPIAIPGSTDWTNAALLPSGQVLVTSDSGDAALFDPQSMSFVTSQASPVARVGALAHVLADGRVLIVGGRTGADLSPLRDAELYDPSTGLFVDIGPMVDGRFRLAVEELADGRVLIVGGSHQSPDRTDPPASGAEMFDPSRVP
jgi:hypothetical protein